MFLGHDNCPAEVGQRDPLGGTALTDLKVSGAAAGLSAGDAIVITGTRGDGVAVSSTMTLSGSETVQSLLDRLNLSGMFGNASR